METEKQPVRGGAEAAATPGLRRTAKRLQSTIARLLGPSGSIRREQTRFLVAAFAPVIGLFVIIRVIPITWVLGLSLSNYSLRRPTVRFVAFENYVRLLDDPLFLLAFKNSLEFLVVSVPIVVVFGLLFAILMNRRLRLEGMYQTLFFLPYILSTVPTSIIWRWIYAPGRFGLANHILMSLGLERVGWLTNPDIALRAIIGMYVWKNLGYYVVVFLVGLKNIPSELREAAEVDGASAWQSSLYVDIPLLKPVILFGTVIASIDAMTVFSIVYVMSQGTDASAGVDITVLAMRIYQEAFVYFNMGYASAISAVLFVTAFAVVLLQFRLLGRE